ncbi:hypothetical protein [Brevundimonas sp. NIBR11]|uniref:hypothetical protein n=1 Tax=Brevundimonas sp. NIBR11 TaxID=3015999 RepID=UPI0022F114BB|nr:hypothetical protein [Brevundimonas sp. NIBR11]
MSEHKAPTERATAALLEIISISQHYQAAIIRGGSAGEVTAIRGKAHDMLDAFLDQKSEAATVVRAMIAGHPDVDGLAQEGARRLLDE